ncbi:Tubulin--tyrosine ligase-like protein 12 [Bienertia sinuspersici]
MVDIKNYEDFLSVHGLLLTATGLPESLYPQLFRKLTSETFDGGDFFQIEPCEDGRQRRLVLTADSMEKNSNVFLVDHAWTFRLADAPKQLEEVPGLVERMASIMCVDADLHEDEEYSADDNNEKMTAQEIVESEICRAKETGSDGAKWLELEELDLDDAKLLDLDLPSKCPNLVALSLFGNKINKIETVLEGISKLKNLRALWLNDNPVLEKCANSMEEVVLQACPKLEIFNSHFTSNYGEWALGFCGEIYGKDNPENHSEHQLQNITSLDLSDRCIHNLNNKAFSPLEIPHLSHLNLRGNPLDENSTQQLFEILKRFPSLNSLEVDIPGPLGESALEILESLPNLFLLNGVKAAKIFETEKHVVDSALQPRLPEWTSDDPLPDRVLNAMWLYLMSYRLADEEKIDETSVWYVMDELGSALRHSDEPNFLITPFLFMPEGNLSSSISFSILWPTQDVHKGDECTRDFLFGIGEDKQRSARLTAWFHTPKNYFIKAYERYLQKLQSKRFTSPAMGSPRPSSLLCNQNALRVYTDIPDVQEFLTRPEFTLTNEPKEADIIWTSMQVDEETKKAVGITDEQYINQFPHESCLVMKHHLAETVQEAHGTPEWLQPTYNLEKHLTELIGEFFVREREGRDNLWILKPWNMARTIDTTITSNLSAIIRLMETGPKICQKYIEHPALFKGKKFEHAALFKGKKFDLRYIVLVRSMNPLEIFLGDVFWVRVANNTYSLDKRSLYEYETHFTVMNYRGTLNHVQTQEFVKEFEQEHQVKWLDIHQRVRNMIRSVFEAAATVHPEMHSPKGRAIYGVDIMLDASFNPKLLEVTYCPDCTRACRYDLNSVLGGGTEIKGSDFFNSVFGCLFLNETTNVTPL